MKLCDAIKRSLFNVILLVGLLTVSVVFPGCSSQQSVTRESTTTTTTDPVDSTATTTETHTQNTEVTSTAPESRGVIGSFFHFIGSVLAFPFKVIGGAIEAIF